MLIQMSGLTTIRFGCIKVDKLEIKMRNNNRNERERNEGGS